jgi:hypothetical protein
LLEVEGEFQTFDNEFVSFLLRLRNVGQSTAVSPEFKVNNTINSWALPTLHAKEETQIEIRWAVQIGIKTPLETQLTYSTLQGYKFADEASLLLWDRLGAAEGFEIAYTLKGRRYLGMSDTALLKMPTFSN